MGKGNGINRFAFSSCIVITICSTRYLEITIVVPINTTIHVIGKKAWRCKLLCPAESSFIQAVYLYSISSSESCKKKERLVVSALKNHTIKQVELCGWSQFRITDTVECHNLKAHSVCFVDWCQLPQHTADPFCLLKANLFVGSG